MNSLFLSFAICILSYLILDFISKKLSANQIIITSTSIRITLFLVAILINFICLYLIDKFITNRDFQFILKSILSGIMLYLTVFILLLNNKKY